MNGKTASHSGCQLPEDVCNILLKLVVWKLEAKKELNVSHVSPILFSVLANMIK